MDKMVQGTPPKREKAEPRDGYRRWFEKEDERVSWKTV